MKQCGLHNTVCSLFEHTAEEKKTFFGISEFSDKATKLI